MTSELSLTNSLMTNTAFPIARVLGGALLCRAYGMISEYTGRDLQIGALLARIIPNQMVSFLERGSNILARPIHELQGFLYEHGYQQIACQHRFNFDPPFIKTTGRKLTHLYKKFHSDGILRCPSAPASV